MLKKGINGLLILGCTFSLVACGKDKTSPIPAFNFDSSVRSRAQTEIGNSNSFSNTPYYEEYSFGVDTETFINIIRERYAEIIQFTGAHFETLEFKKIEGAPTFSNNAKNNTYLVNDCLIINFVIPQFNGIEWDKTVSNIQFFYPHKYLAEGEPDTVQTVLFNLIVSSIVQETTSNNSVLTTSGQYLGSSDGYGCTGGHYSLDKDLNEMNSTAKDFFKEFFDLKNKDRIYAYNFTRY